MSTETQAAAASRSHRILTVVGTILCLILLPILIFNVSLIVKSYTNPEEVPSLGGVFPLIVLTDSMYPEIHSGDLIICHTQDPENVRVGDVISFWDPMGSGTSIVTHKVVALTQEDGQLAWTTRGIANNADDTVPVTAEDLVGVYQSRIPGFGHVVMFMQTTTGLILCVVCPILLLVGWDVLRRRRYEKSRKEDTDALLKELEELRAQKARQEANPE